MNNPDDHDLQPASAEDTAPGDLQQTPAEPQSQPAEEGSRVAELEVQLRAAQQEILRSQAELENYRKRVRREMDDERRYAALPVVGDLLPVIDNLQRAVAHAEQASGDNSALLTGVRMVLQQLEGVLEKHECRRIPAAGELFDPHVHAAIGQQPSDQQPAGFVTHVAVEGYQLHDRVVRPAQVLVSTGPASKNASGDDASN